MRNDFKMFLYLIGLGMALTAFAYTNFATKETVRTLEQKIDVMDERIYDIWVRGK